ncbi:MAG: gliding motility-associated C-terminal domain-containing protein [Bacteroidia bacterium]
MKQILSALALLLFVKIGNAQFYKISDYDKQTLNVCKGQFVSSKFTTVTNGLDLYQPAYLNNENYTVTFCSSISSKIRVNFYYIGLGSGDHLYVYDGTSTASPQIANLTGTVNYPGVFTSTGTCLTFKFVSDNVQDVNQSYGWDSFIGCTPTDCKGNIPASDECISATEICNLDGYCGSTSGWYTRGSEAATLDKPGAFCANIQNNSWLSFIASTTSASFDITPSNCSNPNTGIQAAIFQTTNCKNFTSIATCYSNAKGNFTLATNVPLTIGKKYYIMIDGYDGNDCEYSINANNGVQTVKLTADNSNTLCTGQPFVLSATAVGVGPFTYVWTPTPTSGQNSAVATFPAATGTTYSCSVTGVCTNPTIATFTPSVVTTPVVSAIDSVRICAGGSGTKLTSSLTSSSPTIDFKNLKTSPIPDASATGITSTINVGSITGSVGTDLLNVCIDINHGNDSDLSISLKAPDNTIINLSSNNGGNGDNYVKTCFSSTGPSITTGTAPFTGTFTPQQPLSLLSASPINGVWSLIVIDNKTLDVGLLTGWSLSFKNGFTYSWAPTTALTGNGAAVTANPSSTTTYTASITDKAGCPGTKAVRVNVTDLPIAPIVNSPVVYCINAKANPLKATTGPNIDLVWYTTATGGTSLPSAPTPSTLTSGITFYYVTGKVGLCEGVRSEIKVIVNSKIDASFTYKSENFCQYAANEFPEISPSAVLGTFSSTPSGLVFVNDKTGEIDLRASLPGTYSITNQVAPVGGCAAITSNPFTVTIHAEPILDNKKTATICSGLLLDIPLAGSVPSSFEWQATDNSNTTGESYLTSTATALINDIITNKTINDQIVNYTVKLTSVAHKCVNETPQIVAVTVNPNPVADTTDISIDASSCGTNSGSITGIVNSSGKTPFKYDWQDAFGNTVGTAIDLKNVPPGSYVLTITDANGCLIKIGTGKSLNVISKNKVKAFFTVNPDKGEIPILIKFTNSSVGAINYNWNFGNSITSIEKNPSYKYTERGIFKTCLVADDGAKCFDTTCTTIDAYITSAFIIPNVFTPNNDGTNDIFTIIGKGIESLHAEIFNRWGQKEYEWDTPNGGWDGRSASGQLSPDGTYFVIIKAIGVDGKNLIGKGSFTLLR